VQRIPGRAELAAQARALGLGGSVSNFPLSHEAELRERLAIPDNNQIYCLLPIGYPLDRHGPLGSKPVKEVAFHDKFGTRWAFADTQPNDGWPSRWL
jgi:hypothetical protein